MITSLTPDQIEALLQAEIVGRIGCRLNDDVYVVPVSYAYDGRAVYAHTHEGMKIDAMRQHPQVCFEVDTWQQKGAWQSVIGWGRFEELTGEEERRKALDILLQRKLPTLTSITMQLGSTWPFAPDATENIEGIFFRIVLQNKTGRCEEIDSKALPNS